MNTSKWQCVALKMTCQCWRCLRMVLAPWPEVAQITTGVLKYWIYLLFTAFIMRSEVTLIRLTMKKPTALCCVLNISHVLKIPKNHFKICSDHHSERRRRISSYLPNLWIPVQLQLLSVLHPCLKALKQPQSPASTLPACTRYSWMPRKKCWLRWKQRLKGKICAQSLCPWK